MNSFLKPKYKLLKFEFQNLTYIIHKILPQRYKACPEPAEGTQRIKKVIKKNVSK